MTPQIKQRIERVQQGEGQRTVSGYGGEGYNSIADIGTELAIVQAQMKKYMEDLGL